MIKRIQVLALLVAAGSLLAIPAVGQADKTGSQHNHGKAKGKGKSKGKSCAKKPSVKKGFVVKGTLVSATPTSVTITVTGANRHARIGEGFTDQDLNTPGMQFGTQQYTTPAGDEFALRYSGTGTPSAGDKVRIIGKVKVTRKKCAPNASPADRYADDADIRRVKIIDVTP